MRVLSVPERLQPPVFRQRRRLREPAALLRVRFCELLGQPAGDRSVVSGGVGVRARLQPPSRALVHLALLLQLGKDDTVICGIDHHGDVLGVLRRGTDHRRPADVDVLDDLLVRQAFRDRLAERVQVDHHQVDRLKPLLLHVGLVGGELAPREDAAVHLGMQRLHPPAQHLRRAGEVLDLLHLHALLGEHCGGAARRQDLDPKPGEAAGELHQARLVRDADQRACDSHDAAPYHR